jgi:hypothetical protein
LLPYLADVICWHVKWRELEWVNAHNEHLPNGWENLGKGRVKTMMVFTIVEESKDCVFVARAILKMESIDELKLI